MTKGRQRIKRSVDDEAWFPIHGIFIKNKLQANRAINELDPAQWESLMLYLT